jgi:demethylspheroidene O-methyltransferase
MGADAISLIRVLYDHSDDTVRMLLAKAHAALPDGGRIIISEPMSGGDRPNRAGDAYFGLYCMAMGTGRARSAAEISAHLDAAGFTQIAHRKTARPFITSVVEARKA